MTYQRPQRRHSSICEGNIVLHHRVEKGRCHGKRKGNRRFFNPLADAPKKRQAGVD